MAGTPLELSENSLQNLLYEVFCHLVLKDVLHIAPIAQIITLTWTQRTAQYSMLLALLPMFSSDECCHTNILALCVSSKICR